MYEEISNASTQASTQTSTQGNFISGATQGNNLTNQQANLAPTILGETTGENLSSPEKASSKIPYPRSYGTDIVDEKIQGAKAEGSQSSQSKQHRGTILSEISEGPQRREDYSFEFSPDTQVDNVLIDDFKTFALNNQMSVDTAKQVAGFYESFIQKTNANHAANYRIKDDEMRQACENDMELGGARYNENVRHAKAAMNRFDNGELSKILTESGFGSHPEVIRFMSRVGKALSEKNMVMGQKPQRELSAAELFYPSMRRS